MPDLAAGLSPRSRLMSNNAQDHIKSNAGSSKSAESRGKSGENHHDTLTATSSWSYDDYSESSGQTHWQSTPEERFEDLITSHPKGEDYRDAGVGDYSEAEDADLENAGQAALFLVEGLRWNNGNHIPKAQKTVEWLAEQYPVNEMGNERIWVKESPLDGWDEFDDFRNLLWSDATKPVSCKQDPLPQWARDQETHRKEVRINAINRAFWDVWANQGYATVEDVHNEANQETTVEWTRSILDSFVEEGSLEKTPDPDADCPEPFAPRHYIPEGED